MRQRVTLRGLQVFEAAARLGSLTRASGELGVTPSAVSHQLALLERQLGMRLFSRRPGGIALTREGSALASQLSEGFSVIYDALDTVEGETAGALRVSVLETFALYWLMPRLRGAERIDLAIETSQTLVRFDEDNIDAAIRTGHGRWGDLAADLIFEETMGVFAASADSPPRRLFLSRHRERDWTAWRQTFPESGLEALTPAWVDDTALSIKAASDGAGYCFAGWQIVASELRAGRLEPAHPGELASVHGGYWLVYPPRALKDSRLRALRDWILSQGLDPGNTP